MPIAPAHAVVLTPASQTDGARLGQSVTYRVTVANRGFLPDAFSLTATGATFPTAILDATCTSPLTSTATLAAGATADVCIKVDVPAGSTNGTTDHATITATSAADASVTGTATIDTIAVNVDNLLVDNDTNDPNVAAFYQDALTAAGKTFNYWDLNAHGGTLPTSFASQ